MLINKSVLDLAFRGFKPVYSQANLEASSEFEKTAMTVPSASRDETCA
ncbi:Mu-like prophage major head subunit gpT family protein [Rhodobacter sp. Har01]|nr:Mu-like prophage major head subunit gpT family protein [Rhodobacter sp. Har01]MCB6179646.1 Mu-like prophage major head subunit gpT family protein [Rhodobacter sp. Har01]